MTQSHKIISTMLFLYYGLIVYRKNRVQAVVCVALLFVFAPAVTTVEQEV